MSPERFAGLGLFKWAQTHSFFGPFMNLPFMGGDRRALGSPCTA
jgi:hypothetical protein